MLSLSSQADASISPNQKLPPKEDSFDDSKGFNDIPGDGYDEIDGDGDGFNETDG